MYQNKDAVFFYMEIIKWLINNPVLPNTPETGYFLENLSRVILKKCYKLVAQKAPNSWQDQRVTSKMVRTLNFGQKSPQILQKNRAFQGCHWDPFDLQQKSCSFYFTNDPFSF